MTFLTNVFYYLKTAAKILKMEKDLNLILEPERIIEVNIPFKAENGKFKILKGFRVQHNSWRGPYKGGIRFNPQVDLEEVKALSMLMTIKNSLACLPFGGAKGGLNINPLDFSANQLKKITQIYTQRLADFIGPYLDVPAPDIGTNWQIMDWLVEKYSQIKKQKILAVTTGKSADNGGIKAREIATGFGGGYLLDQAVEELKLKPPLRVAIQGFGNVGLNIAKYLFDQRGKYKIMALSDSKGAIYTGSESKQGFNPYEVEKCVREQGTVAGCYCVGSVCFIPNEHNLISGLELLALDVDILIPAALENQITQEIAKNIKAKIILEMANGPTTPEAAQILKQRKILVLPDILANSGGVIASFYEWQKNLKKTKLSDEEILAGIKKRILTAYKKVKQVAKKHRVDLRQASYILALKNLFSKMPKF